MMADGTELDHRGANQTRAAYEELRAEILHGRLLPNERLTAEGLRQRFHFGASPIREALNRLLAEGMVALEEQKGFRVAPVSREDLQALVKARCWIDGAAVTESIARHDRTWEDALVLALHHLSRARRGQDGADATWERLHRELHMALVGGCGSHWMIRTSGQLFDAAERYRRLGAPQVPEPNELDEHRAIVEACFDRDPARATALLADHYGRTYEVVAASFA
jgi:DNA-binding GntR family transcriptional regulator